MREASLCNSEGEEDLVLSLGMKRFSCGSWSHPVLVVWWAVSRCGM